MDLETALQAIEGVDGDGDARTVQDRTETALLEAGFGVAREVGVPDRGDGRRGRIDLEAFTGTLSVAVEIDYLGLREKSLYKLRHFPGFRVLVLRHARKGRWNAIPDGLDAVIGLGGPPSINRGNDERAE